MGTHSNTRLSDLSFFHRCLSSLDTLDTPQRSAAVFLAIALLAMLVACFQHDSIATGRRITNGDPVVGRHLIFAFACGSCHAIPGIADANGTVGPPLNGFLHRNYIAGSLLNTAENLSLWIRHPEKVQPNTAMPDLGIDEEQARHIAAYLYTLQ